MRCRMSRDDKSNGAAACLQHLLVWTLAAGAFIVAFQSPWSSNISYFHSAAPVDPAMLLASGEGSVELRQEADGHYAVAGAISGISLTFMLDTGATVTAVSEDLARRAGISRCRPTTTNTANGVTRSCLATVAELSFGNFRMANVDVMILPQLTGTEALLGMNVLRHFGIEQRHGRMRISTP